MGKSREAEAAVRNLRGQGALADLVAVGRRTDPLKTLLGLIQESNADTWCQTGEPWHLFIDGVDEASGAAAGFEATLRVFLNELSVSGGDLARMRLRLLCRTVEWTPTLDSLVETFWADAEIEKLQIAPLSERDVTRAVDISTGDAVEAVRFVERISTVGAEALASRPVSLRLLMDLQREHGDLPAGQAELYRLGLEALAEEPDETRRKRARRGALDGPEKLTVASRIAAATAFSGLNKIWVGLDASSQPDDAFRLSDIAGGAEPAPPQSFPVLEADLLDAIRTPLFISVGPETYGWVHQTFMEYLAARYILDHGLTAAETVTFLSVSEPGGARGIAPQWREIAAWVATMSKPFFELLTAEEPDVLLQSDVAAASAEDRERLVDAFLRQLNAGELVDIYFGLRPLLSRLNHPRLAAQLRAFLRTSGFGNFARCATIDIIEENHLNDLAEDLAQLALSEREPILVRRNAAFAVSRLDDPAARRSLAPMLRSDLAEDFDDGLRGAALRALWPDFLSFSTLLSALTPVKQTNLIGSYRMFLRGLDFRDISAEDASIGIGWLRTQPFDRADDDALVEVLSKVFWAAAAQVDKYDVRKVVASFIVERFDTLASWILRVARDVPAAWPKDSGARCSLVHEILDLSPEPEHSARALPYSLPELITPGDLPTYIHALLATEDPRIQAGFVEIIATLTRSVPLDELFSVFDVAERMPILQEALQGLYYVESGSQAAKWMRDSARREREAEARSAERARSADAADQRVIAGLATIEAGEVDEWWPLNLNLFVTAGGLYEGAYEYHSDLTATPGWVRLSTENRERVVDAGLRYLTESRLTTLRWLGTNTQHRPASAAFRALRLLLKERPDTFASLPERVWQTWGSVTVSFFDNDFASSEADQVAILRLAYGNAPEVVLRAIARMALGRTSQGLGNRTMQLLEQIFDFRLGEFLGEVRHRRTLSEQVGGSIFAFLVHMGHPPALSELSDRLNEESDAAPLGRELPDDTIATVAAERMTAGSADIWRRLHDLSHRRPDLAREIWSRYASGSLFHRDTLWPDLSEDLLAEAYLDLERLFPDHPRLEQTRTLSAIDYVEELRGSLLQRLVNQGTAAALTAIARIERALPHKPWIQHRLQEAKRNYRAAARRLYAPNEVISMIATFQPPLPLRNEIDAAQAAIAIDRPLSVKVIEVPDASDAPIPWSLSAGADPASYDRLKVLALATEWRSGHGGISTLNRELCVALAELGHEVCCIALDITADDRMAAQQRGVRLFRCPAPTGIEGTPRFLTLRRHHIDFTPDIVIGHDHITGPGALHIAQEIGSAYVHVLHTVPQESEVYKVRAGSPGYGPLRGYDKAEAQFEVARESKLVVGVGPKVADFADLGLVNGPPVHELIPGLNSELLAYQPNLKRLRRFQCLMTARMNDATLKGARVACDAVKQAALDRVGGDRPRLILRGFTRDAEEAEFEKIGSFVNYRAHVELRAYTDDSNEVHRDIQACSLVVMPSLSEGFGLSAFDAIAAGVPVVLTFESGLAEYILRAINDGIVEKGIRDACIASVIGDDHALIVDEWATKMEAVVSDCDGSFQRAGRLRAALKPVLTWRRAAEEFVKAVVPVIQ